MSDKERRLKEEIDWLYSTQFFGIKLGLENIKKLLSELDCYPSDKTRVIQVAGTNGKGSTSAFIESVARAHGVKTGLFTSPHLIEFSERIRVSGENISDESLLSLIEHVKGTVSAWDPHPTFFELSLALAMRHFLSEGCELIILETGMGGRLDATTAVPKDLSVLTPIGLDHQQYLGETLSEITGEKAAIMRSSKPCVSSLQEGEAVQVIEKVAQEKGSPLTWVTKPLNDNYSLGLYGEHQRWNATLALEALRQLGTITLTEERISQGLKEVQWLGRFQRIKNPAGEIILDCCHNVPAAQELVKAWQHSFGTKKAHLTFGAAQDKNIKEVLRVLLPILSSAEVYTLDNPRGESAEILKTLINELAPELPCEVIDELSELEERPLNLITGSLFLVGEWLQLNASMKRNDLYFPKTVQ